LRALSFNISVRKKAITVGTIELFIIVFVDVAFIEEASEKVLG
jgi:hypothetical protein